VTGSELLEEPPAGAVAVRDLYRLGSNYDVERSPWSLFLDLIGWSADTFGAPLLEAPADDFGYLELSELGAALVEYARAPEGVRRYVDALMEPGEDG
jgi:hypothetical protein